MPPSALLVSSEQADRRFSLLPLARVLVPLCETVSHVILTAGASDSTRADGCSESCDVVDGVRRLRVAITFDRFSRDNAFSGWLSGRASARWTGSAPALLDDLASAADLVVLQSGPAGVLIPRIRRSAHDATLVYFATESLDSVPQPVKGVVTRGLTLVDRAITIRPMLKRELSRVFGGPVDSFTPPPDIAAIAAAGPSPYPDGYNVVVIGGAALDAMAIEIAASTLSDATFHVLGAVETDLPGNVRRLDPSSTPVATAYLLHADLALVASTAPDDSPEGGWLADNLAILGHVGLPTVCPDGAVEAHPRRYVFDPGRSASLREALVSSRAAVPTRVPVPVRNWRALALDLVKETAARDGARVGRTAHAG